MQSHLYNHNGYHLTSHPSNQFNILLNNQWFIHRHDHPLNRNLDQAANPPPCQLLTGKLVHELPSFYYAPENTCRPCPPHSASFERGSISCTCNAGHTSIGFGISLRCRPCPPGFTSKIGAANCSVCPAGSYSPVEGSASCSLCSAGYVSTIEGSSSCTPCSPGHFSSSVGSTVCESVPPGFFAYSPGSTGYQICDQGTYNEEFAQAECRVCSPGTVTANFGSTSSGDCVSPKVNIIAVSR